jgi:hypothetical protein
VATRQATVSERMEITPSGDTQTTLPSPRRTRSRTSSVASQIAELYSPIAGRSRASSPTPSGAGSRGVKRTKIANEEEDSSFSLETTDINEITKMRDDLESFLFNESNKINKVAIKFIMTKWSSLESKLLKTEIENQNLKGRLAEKENYEKRILSKDLKTYLVLVTQTSLQDPAQLRPLLGLVSGPLLPQLLCCL